MKRILFPVSVLAILATGCTSDDMMDNGAQVDNQLQPLSIEASVLTASPVAPGTRSIIYGTAFPNLSQIGVHIAKGVAGDADGNKGVPGVPYANEYFSNQMFHLNGSTWAANEAYNLSADQGTVYAYYPFDDTARFSTAGSTTIPVEIASSGSITVKNGTSASSGINTNDAITSPADGEKDYMFYRPAAARAVVNNRNHTAQITMQHALAQVSFRLIKAATYPGAGKFTKYDIYDTAAKELVTTSATTATMSIVDGSLSLTGATKGHITRNITNYALGTSTPAATIVSNLAFPINTIAADDITVNFYIDGQDHIVKLPVTTNVSDSWEAGKNYLYSITLGGTGVEVTDVSITDWINVPAGEIDMQ